MGPRDAQMLLLSNFSAINWKKSSRRSNEGTPTGPFLFLFRATFSVADPGFLTRGASQASQVLKTPADVVEEGACQVCPLDSPLIFFLKNNPIWRSREVFGPFLWNSWICHWKLCANRQYIATSISWRKYTTNCDQTFENPNYLYVINSIVLLK